MIAFTGEEATTLTDPEQDAREAAYRAAIQEEVRRKGVQPYGPTNRLTGGAGFDREGELDEFLADLSESRHPSRPESAR